MKIALLILLCTVSLNITSGITVIDHTHYVSPTAVLINALSKAVKEKDFDRYFALMDQETPRTQRDLCYLSLGEDEKKALHYAAQEGNAYAIKRLILIGAVIDTKDKYDKTPLLYAAENGNLQCLTVLLEAGANKLAHDNADMTALHWAAKSNNAAAITMLINAGNRGTGLSTNPFLFNGAFRKTPLHKAASAGHVEAIAALLDNGVLVDETDYSSKTALHMAAIQGKQAAVRTLLTRHANPEARDDKGRTPLHYAAERGNVATTLALINGGADVGALDTEGKNLLHFAARSNNPAIIALLVKEYGLDPKSADREGCTPLAEAIIFPTQPCLSKFALQCAGAQLSEREHEQFQNSLHTCLSGLSTNANTLTCLDALAQESLAPWDPNVVDSLSNTTPLMSAVIRGCKACALFLLKDPRTNTNIQNGELKTALHFVVECCFEHGNTLLLCSSLLNLQRTNVSVKNRDGKTARGLLEMMRKRSLLKSTTLEKLTLLFELRKMRVQLFLSLKNARCSEECTDKICLHTIRFPAEISMKIARMLTINSLPSFTY